MYLYYLQSFYILLNASTALHYPRNLNGHNQAGTLTFLIKLSLYSVMFTQ